MTADDHSHDVDCRKVVSELYRYIDHIRRLGVELTPQLEAQIRHHLDDCSPCLEAMDFEYELIEMVRVRCTETLPAGLSDRIRQSMRGPLDPPSAGGIPGI